MTELPGFDLDEMEERRQKLGLQTAAGLALSSGQKRKFEAIMRQGWRFTPATMAHKITAGQWIPAPHLLYISTLIAPAIAAGHARIIVTMPPRHGKSEFLSVNTPIWHLERYPMRQIIQISYGLELVTDFTIRVRDAFKDEELAHLLTTRLKKDKQRVDNFKTLQNGGVIAAGVGGPITGRGAHLMLIDDYIKNAEAALSLSQRDSAWEWFKSTAWTRLEPGSSLIVLATRWDIDDLIGRMIALMPKQNWIVINLPAFARPGDPLGRPEGAALWPERFDEEALEEIKEALGTYWWEAMYQQEPLPSMSGANLGNYLKVIRPEEIPHWHTIKWVRSWDLAATEGGGDWTAGMLMGLHEESGRIYIPDMQHFQKSPYNTELMVKTVAEGDGASTRIKIEQEPGSAGKNTIEHYKRTVLKGYSVEGEKPTGDIAVRAQPFLAAVEAGRVHVCAGPHLEAFRTELNTFPGDHDDMISASALAHYKLTGSRMGSVIWGEDQVIDLGTARRNKSKYGGKSGRGSKRPVIEVTDRKIITGVTW